MNGGAGGNPAWVELGCRWATGRPPFPNWSSAMTVTIDQDEVEAIAPELGDDALADAQWLLLLETAALQVVGFPTERKAQIAGAWLAAHLGTVQKPNSGSGSAPLQSISVGAVSKTFAVSMAMDASSLQSTSYGREYDRLVKMWCPRMAVT